MLLSLNFNPQRVCLLSRVLQIASCKSATQLQVWNVNQYSRFVGVFHVQGSSWDRTKRSFSMHNHSPPPLQTKVLQQQQYTLISADLHRSLLVLWQSSPWTNARPVLMGLKIAPGNHCPCHMSHDPAQECGPLNRGIGLM